MRLFPSSQSDRGFWPDLILFFFAVCFLGWAWEVVLIWLQTGEFSNRGMLHGPWLPIYGSGCVLMVWLKDHIRSNQVLFFLASMGLCGVIEYATSWIMETVYHARWWDYTEQFMNISGRVCLLGLIFFGVAGVLVVYFLYPRLKRLFSRLPFRVKIAADVLLGVLFTADTIWSVFMPNPVLQV